MEKGAPFTTFRLAEIMSAKEKSSTTVKIAQIITLGVFSTTVASLCIFFFATRHTNIASDSMQSCQDQQNHKLMDEDVRRVSELRKENGQILREPINYDVQANTVVIHTPGNFSGDAPATLVIDYDQGLVYVKLEDEDNCMVFSLTNELRQVVNMELLATNGDVIDAATVTVNDNYTTYTVAGEIPNGFVQTYSRPTVSGMCAGRTMYWLDRVERSEDRSNLRQKRGCTIVSILWGLIWWETCT